MAFHTRITEKAKQIINKQLGIRLHRKSARLINTKPMISFTFDDFPMSAVEAGNVLKKNNCNGTYYTCVNFMGATADGEPFYDLAALQHLIADGHEIGSHTFEHLNCKLTDTKKLSGDIKLNNTSLQKLIPEYAMKNFAFPFGEFSFQSKKLMNDAFVSSRSTLPGLNTGIIDLNLLKANKLYNHIPIQTALNLIAENKEKNGWLIFYTHDVKENASPYGCSMSYFEKVLEASIHSGAQIVSVKEALRNIELA